MARRKRSPNSIRWNHRGLNQAGPEADIQCQVCMNQIRSCGDIKTPIEQVDYFVDDDGTLTIKNDICPRTVALALLCLSQESQSTFRQRLGEDYDMFILNLEQILKKHSQTCPGELASQVSAAEKLIGEHRLRQKLLSQSRKRTHELMIQGELKDTMVADANKADAASLPDNFLSIPTQREELTSTKKRESNLPTTVSDIPQSIFDCDNNNNNDNENKEGNEEGMKIGGDEEEEEEEEGNSRTISPSMLPVGMTVAEAAIANKQMANTKRGSKILPVSTTSDGMVKYPCPICSLELAGDHELTVHIRSHNQSHLQVMPNTCTICGKTLSSQSSLDRHMLVHSGERPFKCSICDMSFTTNGNMHRHSRIHQKNGITVLRPQGRKTHGDSKSHSSKSSHSHNPLPSPSSTSSGNTSQFSSNFRDDVTKRKSQGVTPSDQNVEFLHYMSMNDMNNLQQLKLLSMSNYMFPFNTATHPAFQMSPFMQEQMRLQYLQAYLNPLNGESLAKRPCIPPLIVPPVREPSPDLRKSTVHRCKVCGDEFKNQFSLDSHMESHIIVDEKLEAEAGAACKTCKTVAKSAESLLLHTLTHHKPKEDVSIPDAKSDTPPPPKEPAETETENVVVENVLEIEKDPSSFMNLGFADCTTKKFPLIAKAFCEDNPDLKGKNFPVFKCNYCDKEFPVEGAKNLHEASHVPEEYTRCPKCNCHFADSSRLQEHMLKHVSDLKFEESLANNTSGEESKSEVMSQNYFLAQFGLITAEDHKPVDADQDEESERQFDDESMMNASMNDPSESLMSEDADCRMATDNEEDARSCESESRILTIPLNNNKKEGIQDGLSLPSSELLSDVVAMQSLRSPASSIGSDVICQRSQESPHLSSSKLREGVLPPMFPCKYCDSVLSTAADLKAHQSQHKDVSQFKCKICPYASTDKSTLLRHMRTHSGERPYKCKVCDYSFTTKANCERHLRQKHSLDKEDLKDQLIHLQFDVQQILQNANKGNLLKTEDKKICKSCGVDFFHSNALQQHIQMSPECRIVFACKSCKMTFPTKASISQHMSEKHTNIPADRISHYFSSIENTPSLDNENKMNASSPPPAHSKPNTPKIKTKRPLENAEKISTSSKLLKSFLTARNTSKSITINPTLHMQLPVKTEPDAPLDFTQRKEVSSMDNAPSQNLTKTEDTSSVSDDQPLDLSVSRPSPSLDLLKGQGSSPTKQDLMGLPLTIKQEPVSLLSPGNNDGKNSSNRNAKRATSHSPRNPCDRNNNHLSSLIPMASTGNKSVSTILGLSLKPGIPLIAPPSHLPKHPAFPQFLPIMSSLGLAAAPEGPQLPPLSSNVKTTGSSSGDKSLSSNKKKATTLPTSSSVPSSNRMTQVNNDLKVSLQAMQPSVILTNLKEKKHEKGSSSGSESSCELASVTKMLDATDAQNFQDYLAIPETEDEQDSMSVSDLSEEDSNMSMENMFTNSYSNVHKSELLRAPGSDHVPKEMTQQNPLDSDNAGKTEKEITLTVGMALMGGMDEDLDKKILPNGNDDGKIHHPDPSNMSEQDIAKLIEKVSRENDNCPIKKKRNSYADSPHKFSCPYCPRCFPWMSSLNRHLLTHTGQKPFRCSRCPVTFSTKSNRERHLIRKHNINLLDPSSRSTMDRPYKCQSCVFSSFSTKSNLIKHYKERHNGMAPPQKALEAIDVDKSLSDDAEMEDMNGSGKTCEEEEEEYALAQMQQELSENCALLQGYDQDVDYIQNNSTLQRDPHKKRNAIFKLADYDRKQDIMPNQNNDSSNSPKDRNSSARNSPGLKNSPSMATLPGIDETVLTDTVREFLDKSIQQSLEDSQRKALEQGSTFSITPAMERHLKRLSNNNSLPSNNQCIKCPKCDQAFPSKKKFLKHLKTHKLEMPYICHLCETPFGTRVECLQHQAMAHKKEWVELQDRNGIGNLEVFATRLDKLVMKSSKKEKYDKEKELKNNYEESRESKSVEDAKINDEEEEQVHKEKKTLADKESSNGEEAKDGEVNLPVSDRVINIAGPSQDDNVKKVHCALCPKVFQSHSELKNHMQCHTGNQSKTGSQNATSSLNEIPSSSSSVNEDEIISGEDLQMDESDNDDMLHNLLGVESSTIDQIFESKVSAASILGMSGGKGSKP